MRLLPATRHLLAATAFAGCVAAPPAPRPEVQAPAAPDSAQARCELRFVHSRDPLQRAQIASELARLRSPRERVETWPGMELPPSASGLHRRSQATADVVAAYRERSRQQGLVGDDLTALANHLLAREHAWQLGTTAMPAGRSAPATAGPLR